MSLKQPEPADVCMCVCVLLQRHYRSLITAAVLSRPLCSRHRRGDLWCRFKWWEEQQRDKAEHFYLLYKYSSCALTGGIHYHPPFPSPPPACRIIPVGLLGSYRLLTVDLHHRSAPRLLFLHPPPHPAPNLRPRAPTQAAVS